MVAKGKQIAIRTGARVFVNQPGAAIGFQGFEDDETQLGMLLAQHASAADPGNAGTDNDDVEVFHAIRGSVGGLGRKHLSLQFA